MDAKHDVTVLNTLITTTIDSVDGFERSADDAQGKRFETMFRDFARERREAVARLQARVRALGGTPNDDGSLKAGVHRRWLDMKSALTGGGDKQVIEEVERGEDYIKEKYETALDDGGLSAETRAVIASCYESVRRGHDRASALKHNLAEA